VASITVSHLDHDAEINRLELNVVHEGNQINHASMYYDTGILQDVFQVNTLLGASNGINSNRNITAANSEAFSKSLNQIGGQLNIASDVSNSSYILNNLSCGFLANGSLSSPVFPSIGVSLIGFTGYM